MKIRKTLGMIICAASIMYDATSQPLTQTIKGTIVDNETQVTLPGAVIVVLGTNPLKGTSADADGNYKLEQVPLGRYDISVSFLGYETHITREILVGSGKEVVLNIGLKESLVKIDEVVVKANAEKKEPLNSMSTISARQINVEEAARYAGGFDDPSRLVSSFAGVAGNLSSNGIVVRGNAPRGLLWRMEGVEISNPNHFADVTTFGAGGITALSSQMLSNSDFFTGAFPAEYGNALSGVFDLKLRTGNNEKREYTLQAGIIGLDFSSEGPFMKGRKASYLFNYRYSTFALIAPLLPKNAGRIRYQDLSFKCNFPAKKAGTFSIWGIWATDISGQYAKEDSLLWEYQTDREDVLADQYTGAIGVTHKWIVGGKTYMNTSIAASGNGLQWDLKRLDNALLYVPNEKIKSNTWKYTFSTFLNHKFNAKHTNRTGFIYNTLAYNIDIQHSETDGGPLIQIVREDGMANLVQAYSQSKFDVSPEVSVNLGSHVQYFTLNGHYSVEPRIGLKWKFAPAHAFSFGYGRHSRIEMLGVYLAQQQTPDGRKRVNKNLDFSKADHVVIGYDWGINKNLHLKIEPYFQRLFNIPVIPDSSFSLQNLERDWFLNDSLVNRGKGMNVGIDLTLEKFLDNGYYYLFTTSFFDSKYTGGDGIERNARFNRHYVLNILGGKEWKVGKGRKNILGVNGRVSFLGGDRISPVNEPLSLQNKEIVYDEYRAFEHRKPNVYYLYFTLNYRVNKPKYSSIWALQLINVLGAKEFNGYKYNNKKVTIDKDEEVTMVPNLSYKIEF